MHKARILFALCAIGMAFSANAATFCVKPPPNNALCEPTIQDVVDLATMPGDIVKIATGIYEETVTLGAAQTGITLMGAGVGKTIIDTAEIGTRALNVIGANNVTVAGISIRNNSPAAADAVVVAGSNNVFSLNTAKDNRPGSDYCDVASATGTVPDFADLPGDNVFGSVTQICIGE